MRWPQKVSAVLLAGVASAALAGPALGQIPATAEVQRLGPTARVLLTLPESEGGDLTADAEIAANLVVVARLSEPIEADLSALRQSAPDIIAMARLDADGRTLRLALNRAVEPRVSVSHNVIALDLSPPGAAAPAAVVSAFEQARAAEAQARARAAVAAAAPPPPPPALPVEMRIGEASAYTRIAFQWPEAVTWALETAPESAVLRFSRAADIDLAELTVTPPANVVAARRLDEPVLAIALDLPPGAEARVWSDEPGRVVLDVAPQAGGETEAALAALAAYAQQTAPAEPATGSDLSVGAAPDPATDPTDSQAATGASAVTPDAAETEAAAPAEARPDPLPPGGAVPVQVRQSGGDLVLNFPFASLPGAAVFRRGAALWIVFDAPALLETGELAAAGSSHVRRFRAQTGPDHAALRIEAPASTLADVRAAGAIWSVTLSDSLAEPPLPVRLTRETGFNRPAVVRVGLDSARSVVSVADPVVGDRLLVLAADGEKRGVLSPRRFVEASVLPSAHGVALETFVDDLVFTTEPGGAQLSRPGGLRLSRAADPSLGGSAADRPVTAGFLDLARWRGEQPFVQGRQRLQAAAVEMEPEPLLALAKFHLGWGLAHEALGYLNMATRVNPALEAAPETAALRGVAEYMAGRYEDATRSLDHPALINDPAAQPWRALLAAERRDWPTARRRFEAGRDAAYFFDPVWRARIGAWHALAALETGDLGAVGTLLDDAEASAPDAEAQAVAAFARAGLLARSGDIPGAVAAYEALRADPWRPIQTRAGLASVVLQSSNGLMSADEAVEELESLRFQWRGDDTEVEAAAMLGRVYAQAGRYGEALETMDGTRARFPDSPVARAISLEMETLFRQLFLEGGAERMDPLTAVALWREHQTLTPPGPDGVRMVMGVVRRLVEIDLLDQAAAYLQYWVDEPSITLTGQARASIAADLAEIYLSDGRAELALRAIEQTRIAGLPADLVSDRRLLQARALAAVGRTEHALELIASETSPEAERLRARIAWDGRRWPDAGRRAESLLGDRWREDGALTASESHDVLRALIAYALAGDAASTDRIEARYGAQMAATDHAGAFSLVANQSVSPGDSRLATLIDELARLEDSTSLTRGFRSLEADPSAATGIDGAGPS